MNDDVIKGIRIALTELRKHNEIMNLDKETGSFDKYLRVEDVIRVTEMNLFGLLKVK